MSTRNLHPDYVLLEGAVGLDLRSAEIRYRLLLKAQNAIDARAGLSAEAPSGELPIDLANAACDPMCTCIHPQSHHVGPDHTGICRESTCPCMAFVLKKD